MSSDEAKRERVISENFAVLIIFIFILGNF